MNISHWTIVISISTNDYIDTLHNTLESLVKIFHFQLQFKKCTVHFVHEKNRLDALRDGLSQYSFSLDTNTYQENQNNNINFSSASLVLSHSILGFTIYKTLLLQKAIKFFFLNRLQEFDLTLFGIYKLPIK